MTRVLYILSSFKKNIDYFRFYGSVKIVNGNISVKLKSHVIRFLKIYLSQVNITIIHLFNDTYNVQTGKGFG